MLQNIQKSLTACKKLQKSDEYGDKVSVFEELNFLRQIIKDSEALRKSSKHMLLIWNMLTWLR